MPIARRYRQVIGSLWPLCGADEPDMTNRRIKLARYGSQRLWQDTFRELAGAAPLLPDYLGPLTGKMRQSGLALEHEAVWLSVL